MIVNIKVLQDSQLEKIHGATLTYLEKHGVVIKHAKSREMLKNKGATIDGENVKIPKAIVEEALKSVPSSFTIRGRNDRHSVTIGEGHPLVVAPTTGNAFITEESGKRYAEFEDLIKLLKIAHTSDCCHMVAPGIVFPQTDNVEEMMCQQMYETIRLSDKPIIGFTQNEKMARVSIEMANIALGNDTGYNIIGILNTFSPLEWDENMAGALCVYAEKNQPIGITCCSMAGMTSHIHLIDTVFSNNVEIITGIVLAQVIRPGLPIIYGNVSGPSDMKVMNLSIGSPDTLLISAAASQMANYYGIPFRGGGGLTDGKTLDAQTGVESSASLLFSHMNRVHFMLHALGALEAYNGMSFEKWILDEESIRRSRYMMEKDLGELSDEAIEKAAKVGPGGNYIQQEDTLKNFRNGFFMPQVADRFFYDVWKKKGLNIQQTCKKIWEKRVDQYVQPAFSPALEQDLKKYLSVLNQ